MFSFLLKFAVQEAEIADEVEQITWDRYYPNVKHKIYSTTDYILSQNYHVFRCQFANINNTNIFVSNCLYFMVSYSDFANCSTSPTIILNANKNITCVRCCFINSKGDRNTPGVAILLNPVHYIKENVTFYLDESSFASCGYSKDNLDIALIYVFDYPIISLLSTNISNNKFKTSPTLDLQNAVTRIKLSTFENNTASDGQIFKQSKSDVYRLIECGHELTYCNIIGNYCKNGYLFNVTQITIDNCYIKDNVVKENFSNQNIEKHQQNTKIKLNHLNMLGCFANYPLPTEEISERTDQVNVYRLIRLKYNPMT